MADRGLVYDIAMSFAGAQRAAVERIVRACERLGVTVFYDQDHTAQLWGNDIIGHMRTIYGGNRARYVVPFLSKEYLTSGYPMDELRAAISHGISIGDDSYILPVVVGDVDVPAELVSRDIGFLRLEDHSADELAHIIAERVSGTHNPHHRTGQTRPITGDRSRRRSIWLTLAFTVVVLGTGSVVGATLWARATAASGSTPPDPARGARGLSPTATAPA